MKSRRTRRSKKVRKISRRQRRMRGGDEIEDLKKAAEAAIISIGKKLDTYLDVLINAGKNSAGVYNPQSITHNGKTYTYSLTKQQLGSVPTYTITVVESTNPSVQATVYTLTDH